MSIDQGGSRASLSAPPDQQLDKRITTWFNSTEHYARQLHEMDRSTYRGFCRAYGHDVLGWEGLPLIDRVADLAGVVFRLWDSRHHGRDLDWLPGELRLWRSPV